jgi:hypothetical protein
MMVINVAVPLTTDRVHSADEGRALFEREAQRLLGIDGEEFLRRWDAGGYRDLPETPTVRNVMRVAFLIPFVRQES